MAAKLVVLLFVALATADLYMHSLRGSNNRNREANGNVNNNARLFNSQNNNAGGYCWGPKMFFYVGSLLRIEWTNQHACGAGAPNVHCQLIIQYMADNMTDPSGYAQVRDGITTDQITEDADPTSGNYFNRLATSDPDGGGEVYHYGMHENYWYYRNCTVRQRNKGLFVADQNNNIGNNARHTRQNTGGGRRGFECQEERDYYPYWHPSPWKDIAILTDDVSKCAYYKEESFNVKDRNLCSKPQHNNEHDCLSDGGQWEVYPAWGIPAPDCRAGAISRDNHLGNAIEFDVYGNPVTAHYDWTIPDDVTPAAVLRLRYNISTGDFDMWTTDSTFNGESSPVKDDPFYDVAGDASMGEYNVSLAIDTTQFARTFQDRSYTFEIRERPTGLHQPLAGAKIYNLNVRGKRGNIVQTYPSTEYDFVPTFLQVAVGDWIHFQWTGCDTNPQGNDGEGTRGTDRSNIVQLTDLHNNLPMTDDTSGNGNKWLFTDPEVRARFTHLDQDLSGASGQCLTYEQLLTKHGSVNDDFDRDVQNCMKLNGAEPYFDGGLIQMNRAGNFYYMSSRNNNFSNRSHKGAILVSTLVPTWSVAVLSIGAGLFVVAIVLVILKFASANNPTLAGCFGN